MNPAVLKWLQLRSDRAYSGFGYQPISDLKELSGKDNDEDRERNWIGKVKSAFLRDQAPYSEKCLVFGDILTESARNWYRQLSRLTRTSWKYVLESFMMQYCDRCSRAIQLFKSEEDF